MWAESVIGLPPDEARHALRVLRLKSGDQVTVTDGRGRIAHCKLAQRTEELVEAEIAEVEEQRRAKPDLVVYQSIAKRQRNDEVVQRLAELGAAEVWMFPARRSVARWDEEKALPLTIRWNSIARAAAKQSRSAWLTEVGVLGSAQLARQVAGEALAVVLWEEASIPLREALPPAAERIALVVGPEGGLEASEVEALAGARPVSLGNKILRTEFAPIVGASVVLYHFGVIG
ncbi:MAG TPA: RsmE family RNA methyltransferase [Actinomycetota bacterium]|nr:RsmE family RNA methyltransferase [Actinomycetota bacterium]